MLSRPISLAIVDDHALFRKTLKNFLCEQQNIHVAVEVPDVFTLFNRLKTTPIDVLLMDIFLPGMNGDEALMNIRLQYPDVKILMLSMCTDMDLICDLLEKGIHGYISKGDEPEDLLQAIRTVSENRIFRNRLFTEALYWNKQNTFKSVAERNHVLLNEREKKILQLMWEEKSNKEIADALFLGVRSVEKIRQDLKEKVGVKSTVGLLKYAINKRIIGASVQKPDLIK
ncbi:MAG TPA: response regulator transcription factor [Puia sp.]|jgi:DNA-binding NarL/FixJ family response regulator|nr:response regulator transcription factor [Puia sp.]